MVLETTDGIGVLAYAGLGATPNGTQPSEWMSAVLRGRGGLSFEQALGVLSAAANKELPRHLLGVPGGAHFIIVPAFIRGVGARLYTIDKVVDRTTGKHWYRYTSHQRTALPGSTSPRLALAGTGGLYLARKEPVWHRELLHVVNAHDRGKLSDDLIADHVAKLTYEAHQKVTDGAVGPNCIVVWRRRQDLRRPVSGGGHQFYSGVNRDRHSHALPTIANGMDVRSLVGMLMDQFQRSLADGGVRPAVFDISKDEMNRRLAECLSITRMNLPV